VRWCLTKYGRRELIFTSLGCIVVVGLLVWWCWPLAVFSLLLWGGILAFFRDPDRVTPAEPGLFVSPADGRVTDISNVGPESDLGCNGVRVGVFMSLLNVHVNYSPAAGTVESIEHRPGRFFDARQVRAWRNNESTTIKLTVHHDDCDYPLVVRQVAGMIARRIVTDLAPGRRLHRGERIGMIKFGSRLELIVPDELVGRVCVRIGSKVRGARTVLITTDGEAREDGTP